MDDVGSRLRAALADRYDIERLVGEGRVALVFAAWDRKYERTVALKVLRPEVAAAIGPDRFTRETRIVGKLSHPHILPLFEAGEAGGLLYFSMPLAQGESLRQRLEREGRLPVREAIRITREVCDALRHAHERGVVHRDVKPANILLSGGHAVVADFGIAAAVDAAGWSPAERSGGVMGSPAFMSPEQLAASGSVDHRSDQYSLACVLYEMLAGARPVQGRDTGEILQGKFTYVPPPVRAYGRPVPGSLDRVLDRALSIRPRDRFASMGEFAAALGPSLEDLALRPHLVLRSLWHYRRILAAAALALLVVAVAVLWSWG